MLMWATNVKHCVYKQLKLQKYRSQHSYYNDDDDDNNNNNVPILLTKQTNATLIVTAIKYKNYKNLELFRLT
jgi:hypothetical protein